MAHIRETKPDPKNARKHGVRNLATIERSIQRDGFGRSVLLANDGTIIAGNATIEASSSAGLEDMLIVDSDGSKVIAIRRTDVEPGSERFTNLALADNRANEQSDWDSEMLRQLADDGADLGAFWFDEELDALLANLEPPVALTDPDAVPEPPVDPITKPGDLWLLGEHRLYCGDSTVVTDVDRLMNGEKADMVFTDPPYGVAYKGKTADALTIENDDFQGDALRQFLRDAFALVDMALKPGAAYYVAHPDIFAYEFIGAVRDVGWRQARPPVVLWIKDSFVMGRGDYHSRSEPILYGWKPGAAHHAVADRTQDNVWEIDRPKSSQEHPTMKPIELVERAIGNSSNPSDIVLDLFGGSGSTLIACEQTGRRCRMMELDCRYCDVIVRRFEELTGKTATLAPAPHETAA